MIKTKQGHEMVIYIEGGLIDKIVSTTQINVKVIDRDCEKVGENPISYPNIIIQNPLVADKHETSERNR